jgi:hypothetical protein
MTYEVDYDAGEREGCSSRLTIEDRIFYVKLFQLPEGSAKYFSGDQKGVVQKEISKGEFELWLNILADKEFNVNDIRAKISLGKKY